MSIWFTIIIELQSKGMSHEQCAREAGVTRKTVENWAAGRTEPPYSKAIKLLDVYTSVIGST